MFRIWAEIWNATESTFYGMVDLSALTVERRLDGIGSIKLDLPIQDPNAQYLQIGRVARVYTTHPYGQKRYITTALLQKSTLRVTASGDTVSWDAFDRFEELRRLTTYMGRNYNGYALSVALEDLMGLAPTWLVQLAGVTEDTAARFDGTQVMNALQTFAELHGYHFRLSKNLDRLLEFGVFGQDSGIRATNLRLSDHTVVSAGNVFLFDRLDLIQDGGEIVNWIYPLFGNNEAFIDIGVWANASGGIGGVIPDIYYATQSIADGNGNLIYYLADTTSIAAYGLHQRTLIADRLFGVSTAFDASAMLFLWAQNWLLRRKDPQTIYRVGLTQWTDQLNVGDKLTVVYRGEVYQQGEKVRYTDIDASLWILKMMERYTVTGVTMDIDVSNVDLYQNDAISIIARAIETQQRRVMAPEMRLQKSTTTATSTVDSSTPGSLDFELSGDGLSIARARLFVTRSNASTGPDTLEITINGTVISGGPFLNGSGAGLYAEADLKPYVTAAVSAYTVSASCLYGSGSLTLRVDVHEIVGSVT